MTLLDSLILIHWIVLSNVWTHGARAIATLFAKLPVYTVIAGNDLSTEKTQNSNINNDVAPAKTVLNYTCWMGYMENKECILWSWRSSSFARSTSSPGVRSRTVGSRESGLHDCRSKMLMKGIQNIGYKWQVTGVISDEMWSYMLFYRLQ